MALGQSPETAAGGKSMILTARSRALRRRARVARVGERPRAGTPAVQRRGQPFCGSLARRARHPDRWPGCTCRLASWHERERARGPDRQQPALDAHPHEGARHPGRGLRHRRATWAPGQRAPGVRAGRRRHACIHEGPRVAPAGHGRHRGRPLHRRHRRREPPPDPHRDGGDHRPLLVGSFSSEAPGTRN